MHILIIEDEVRLADALGQIMREAKYLTDVVYDGNDGLQYALCGQYDVIVMDVMLPSMNGFDLVKEIRSRKIATPVLMLTARDDVRDKIQGLDRGADDYMTKPFVPEELLARIRALSRRQGEVVIEEMQYLDLVLELTANDLWCRGRSVRLGFKEFEIMKILLSRPRMITSKEMLIARVWGVEADIEDNNVEAYISFLRKKLNFLASRVRIVTVRKVGYRLEERE